MAKEALSKSDLVERVAKATGLPKKHVKPAIEALFSTIADALAEGKKVQVAGFGVFEVRQRKERTGVRPGTGEKITIPARKVPAFKPGKPLKERIS